MTELKSADIGEPIIFNPPRKQVYVFKDGTVVSLENVTELVVRPSGDHRLQTSDGLRHIVAPGWIYNLLGIGSATESEAKPVATGKPIIINPPSPYRTYTYPNGLIITVKSIAELTVTETGEHILKSEEGIDRTVLPGWLHIALKISKWTV